MKDVLPPSSVQGVFWFAFFCFLVTSVILYGAAEWLARRHRVFHHISCLLTAISALSYLILAGTYLGFLTVDGDCVYWVRYVDLALTLPLLLLALGLMSATRLTELLFLASVASLMSFTQLFNALHPEGNRWLFFVLNVLLVVPPLSALTSGFRAQAGLKLGPAVAARVGHLSLIVLLYVIVQQLFLLLTKCLVYIEGTNDVIALTIADVFVKVTFSAVVMWSGDVIVKAVEGDPLLSALCGEAEGEALGEEGLETNIGRMRMRGTDPMHMKPEATERTGLRSKA